MSWNCNRKIEQIKRWLGLGFGLGLGLRFILEHGIITKIELAPLYSAQPAPRTNPIRRIYKGNFVQFGYRLGYQARVLHLFLLLGIASFCFAQQLKITITQYTFNKV